MAVPAPSSLIASVTQVIKIQLAWTNNAFYDGVEIYRKPAGGSYYWIHSTGSGVTAWLNSGLSDGTKYYYKLKAFIGEEDSPFSNEANATTQLPAPSGLSGYSNAGGTEAPLTWNDNSQNEASFKVYKNGALLYTTAANATSYTATGLTPGATYTFYIKAYNAAAGYSAASNTLELTMADPPAKPSGLTATPTGTTTIRLNWTDNSDNEVDFHVERSATSGTAGFSQIGTVGANVKTYGDTGRTSNTQYWYRVRAHNASGYSGYSNVATAVTFAAIAVPTNLVCTAAKVGGAYGVECIFEDNSELEDSHIIERKTTGAYAELVTLAPNRTYYHDATAAAGTTYTYRVRAKQGASTYSSYSNEAEIAVPDVPAAPTGLAISEYQDTWVKITWVKTSGEVGYSIEMNTSGGAYAEIARIEAGIESFKKTGLAASILYGFKIRAYSGAGNSAYTSPVTQTTRAAYLPSKFEKFIRKSKPKLVFLVEANPLMEITGWTITSGMTYEAAFDEGGAALDAVYENGVALIAKTSIVTVEAKAGTYWHDTANKKVYIHTLGGDDPINALITGSFWLYFTTWQRGATIYNGNFYLPLVAADGIPDISQAIQPYYEGTFAVSSGTVSLINGKIRKAFYFDHRYARYLWLNRKVKFLAGGETFTYAEFATINTGSVNSISIDDRRMSLDLRDFRDGLNKEIPSEFYSMDMFPLMDTNGKDKARPFGFGAIANAIPTQIDTTNRVFEFQNGRVKSVTATQNGTSLVENTDFFVDYQRGRLTLARGLGYSSSDILLVSFTGCVNPADEANVTGAEVFLYICRSFLGCALADMDLDAIYATKYAKTTALSLYMRGGVNSSNYIRTIEQSIQSYTMQDAQGRLGIRAEQTAPLSGAPYVWDLHVFDFQAIKGQDQLYSGINIYYAENPQNDIYSLSQMFRPTMTWRYGINKSLDLYVALADASDAAALGTAIADMMERQQISFTIPRVLYTCLPGDVIYFSRVRFPSLAGTAANLPVRILGISKLISSGKTSITAEVV
jgi:fibronectin type 3 domain-containing protein